MRTAASDDLGHRLRLDLWADIQRDKSSEDWCRRRIASCSGSERALVESRLDAIVDDEQSLWDALAAAQSL